MYSLKYKVTTSTCDSEGRLKLYSALQMMQDCSEVWIDSEPGVKQYFTEQNMAQLLATRQVEIVRVPGYKEELTVTTSVYGMKPIDMDYMGIDEDTDFDMELSKDFIREVEKFYRDNGRIPTADELKRLVEKYDYGCHPAPDGDIEPFD